MVRYYLFSIVFIFILFLTACNAGQSESAKSENANDMAYETKESNQEMNNDSAAKESQNQKSVTLKSESQNRMVIYNADLQLQVDDYKRIQSSIEKLVKEMKGYIVESNVYDQGEQQIEGRLTVRIPQENFTTFIDTVEKMSEKVRFRNVTGQDVTEEYVDLESRLKSKLVVEERLMQFMKEAKETKDLLQISADLASIQEEIEQIKGKMSYLENKASLSTVTMTLFENKVVIPDIDSGELNTWEKTKKQFMGSINFILGAASGFIVFIIGNSPILILLVVISVILFLFIRKIKQQNNSSNQGRSGD
ncbi:DUF4349 domain-containing protein [Cytobacillus sp. S13-E01]|uniref:DUF4349 domain-containing protein n=1 Tax=Cytobacillus sp. S13-E01 TaxID=3031326 RepID=UPI0023D8160E|nr:DUF4349 domain-containing protein [Cytobacillus sp. S13-E01]MDF0725362.1 DUF4349 domain-containing protein [Cytobacillus sp. S13-E01]